MADILSRIVDRLHGDHGARWSQFRLAAWKTTRKRRRIRVLDRIDRGFFLIAELKKASPSKGLIRADFDVDALVASYEQGGASALSVLTEEAHFQGSLAHLVRAGERTDLVLLRKEFVVHECQVAEAFDAGADMVLLIAAILDDARLTELRNFIVDLGMTALVEVHDEAELDRVLRLGCDLIGVNNRNLKTFAVDIETAFRLKRRTPGDVRMIAESGIETPEQIVRLQSSGFAGALVGESLLRQRDVAEATRHLLSGL